MYDKRLIYKDLKTNFMGQKIVTLDNTDSTNLRIRAAAENREENGTLIIAENQSKGRGQIGTNWFSAPGESISMSLLVYPRNIKDYNLSVIPLAVGLAVSESLRYIVKKEFELKWPNDILLKSKKICGILCEKFTSQGKICMAIGIGINVNNKIIPQKLENRATSLLIAEKRKFKRETIISQILNIFETLYYRLQLNNTPEEIINEYKSKCVSIGKNIKFIKNRQTFLGKIVDISLQGELVVKNEYGNYINLNSSKSIIGFLQN